MNLVQLHRERPAEWLRATVAEHRANDPIGPISVVTGSAAGALATRRALGRSGSVNVHCTILLRLAEALGGQRLATTGFSPLTPLVELAVARKLLDSPNAGVVRSASPHRSLVEALASSLPKLRQRDLTASERSELASRGQLPEVLIALFGDYEALLKTERFYDGRDLLDAAADAVADGVWLGDVGPVIVHTPLVLSPGSVRLLAALDTRTLVTVSLLASGPPEAADAARRIEAALTPSTTVEPTTGGPRSTPRLHLTTAPTAVEEVRLAVRRVLADCEAGVPLYRMAILHKQDRVYAQLISDVLSEAGAPFTVIGGRRLADSYAARGLLGLLRLRNSNFSRIAVVTWVTSFPRRHPGVPDPPVWDRLSRQVGVVRDVDEWRTRLERYAAGLRVEADDTSNEQLSDARRNAMRHEADDADAIAASVASLHASTTPPSTCTWETLGQWANTLMADHVVDDGWPPIEAEAAQVITELLTALGQADSLGVTPTVDVLIDTLEGLLEARRQPLGRFGTGIVVGDVEAAAGMTFDRVHILGMTESAFPSQPSSDPFLPATVAGGLLDDRQERLGAEALAFAAACAGVAHDGVAYLSTAVWDEGDRPVYPSRWFVAAANELSGEHNTSAQVRMHRSAAWLDAIPSPLAGLLSAPTALNLAQRRLAQVADGHRLQRRLDQSPLAARADLPLQRAMAIRSARWSSSLTAADGNLADPLLDAHLPIAANAVDLSRLQSATRLEEWAACPYKFFLNRVLRVEATDYPEDDDRWSISALERGSVVHDILDAFLGQLIAEGRPLPDEDYTAADRARLTAIAEEKLAELEQRGLTGHPLIWATAKPSILADLLTFLVRDTEARHDGGWTPLAVEQHFGYADQPTSWPALGEAFSDGTTLNLRGKIDRVDVKPSAVDVQFARVLDYKTGGAYVKQSELADDPVRAGTSLQLALYARALRQAYPDLTEIEAAYWYISSKGAFTTVSTTIDAAAEERLMEVLEQVSGGIRAGSFPQAPGGETFRPGRVSWDNCVYCPFDRVCPSGRDGLHDRKVDDPASQRHASLVRDNTKGHPA